MTERVTAPAALLGYDLPVLGVTGVPETLCWYQHDGERWWLVADHRVDPARVNGSAVLPAREERVLRQLQNAGVDVDFVFLAHEVMDAGWTPGADLPVLVPPPSRPGKVDHAIRDGLVVLFQTVRGVIVATATGVVATTDAALSSPALAARSARRTPSASSDGDWGDWGDPIILGGVQVGDRVAWVELTRWTWNQR